MRIVLHVVSGADSGKRVLLRRGELHVGRSSIAELSCPGDELMAERHFKIYADHDRCCVADLHSEHGTLVNGEPCQGATAVENGDVIIAGRTEFCVQIGDADADSALQAANARRATMLASAPPTLPADVIEFTAEKCPSGMWRYSGALGEFDASQLAESLTAAHPVHLIADIAKLGKSAEDVPQAKPLFTWLPDEAAAKMPVLVDTTDKQVWAPLVDDGWRNDAVICMYSDWEHERLLERMRQLVQRDEGAGRTMAVGCCWPSILASLLYCQREGLVDRYTEATTATLMESPHDASMWHVYANEAFRDTLTVLGMQYNAPPEESNEEDKTNP